MFEEILNFIKGFFDIDLKESDYSLFITLFYAITITTIIWQILTKNVTLICSKHFLNKKEELDRKYEQLDIDDSIKLENAKMLDGDFNNLSKKLRLSVNREFHKYIWILVIFVVFSCLIAIIGKTNYLGLLNIYVIFPPIYFLCRLHKCSKEGKKDIDECYQTIVSYLHVLQRKKNESESTE